MPLPAQAEYEALIYQVAENHAEVLRSTLHLYSTSALTAIVEGEVYLSNGLTLRVLEVLNFKTRRIQKYSYTVFRGAERIRWYDPQPHPDVSELASTFPHHLHDPPDIKRNRQPAPGISFDAPNLATLIADCVELGKTPEPD